MIPKGIEETEAFFSRQAKTTASLKAQKRIRKAMMSWNRRQ